MVFLAAILILLVDSQLNAKLADLELGQNAGETTRLHDSESMLLNWVAPEAYLHISFDNLEIDSSW